MRILLALGISMLLCGSTQAKGWQHELSTEIPHRVLKISYPFDVEYTPVVKKQIDGYLRRGRRETEKMLSRSAMYFPII